MEFWVQTTVKTGTVCIGDNISLSVGWNASQLEFRIGDGGTWATCTITSAAVNDLLADGSWHYIAAVWDGTTQTIYVDAVSAATATPAAIVVTNPSGWYVGGAPPGGPFVTGRIDEMRISETARTAQEITNHFNGLP